jgi:deazaflavin-dependent oxidoreductase (nitroreductase family)
MTKRTVASEIDGRPVEGTPAVLWYSRSAIPAMGECWHLPTPRPALARSRERGHDRAVNLPQPIISAGVWALENGHRTLLALTGGRFPQSIAGMPTLELHTIGAKSGERRSRLLTSPIVEDGRVVLIGSNGGGATSPAWVANLRANPEVEITTGGETHHYRARVATGDERAELWKRVVKRYRGYETYQRRAPREIPVVVCERIDEPGK